MLQGIVYGTIPEANNIMITKTTTIRMIILDGRKKIW